MITVFVLFIVASVFAGMLASKRGRSGFGYFLLALLITPLLTFILVLILDDLTGWKSDDPRISALKEREKERLKFLKERENNKIDLNMKYRIQENSLDNKIINSKTDDVELDYSRWKILIEVDDDIAAAYNKVMSIDSNAAEQFAKKYLILNDKNYLNSLLEKTLKNMKLRFKFEVQLLVTC